MGRVMAFGRGVAPWIMLLTLSACVGSTHLSFLDPQGPVADAQRSHFYWVLGIMAVLVAGPIFLLLPFFVWRYRYGNKAARYTPRWEYSRLLEIMSWSGPIVIVLVLAFFVWRDAHRLDPYKPLASDQAPLQVEVIGYDWKWLFIYPDQGIASIGTLALPTGRPVSLHLTSATVMQSFFIPALGSQIYAMGGMVTQLNLQASQPGASLGENTMYNGDGFHQQKFTARATSPADFEAWVDKVRATGLPLNAQHLAMVARRGSRSDLIAALPAARSMNGDVYFTGVSRSLFPAVVMATMAGRPTLADAAFDPTVAAMPSAVDAGHAMTGMAR
jgi:cytochrome o ubiquinol oxidase subunit 2